MMTYVRTSLKIKKVNKVKKRKEDERTELPQRQDLNKEKKRKWRTRLSHIYGFATGQEQSSMNKRNPGAPSVFTLSKRDTLLLYVRNSKISTKASSSSSSSSSCCCSKILKYRKRRRRGRRRRKKERSNSLQTLC